MFKLRGCVCVGCMCVQAVELPLHAKEALSLLVD